MTAPSPTAGCSIALPIGTAYVSAVKLVRCTLPYIIVAQRKAKAGTLLDLPCSWLNLTELRLTLQAASRQPFVSQTT